MKKNYLIDGFKASGLVCGIKKKEKKDLGLIFSEKKASFAALFTTNKIKAAPVLLGIKRAKKGLAQAFIANSGNANCSVGKIGLEDAKEMSKCIAKELNISEELVIPSSTGVIGQKLPIEKIQSKAKELAVNLNKNSFEDFAEAILTTDTKIKMVKKQGFINTEKFEILGIVKGAGMINPNMATLLCYILSDIKANPSTLKKALKTAADISLNKLTIDGDTSTNDSVLFMANGFSKACAEDNLETFQKVLNELLIELSKMLVQDGEGVKKLVQVNVINALNNKDAYKIARSIANSKLVQTAIFGEDANWGRIMMAIGKAKAKINPDTINISFDDIMIAKNSLYVSKEAEEQVNKILKKDEFSITVDLNLGKAKESILTCDLSYDYIKINADYRS